MLEEIHDGIYFARQYKFLKQYKNKYLEYRLPFERITAKSFYLKHKDLFDKYAAIINKYHIDSLGYLKFYLFEMNKSDFDIELFLLDIKTLKMYADKMYIIDKRRKVYRYICKSIKNIANDCIKLDYTNIQDYLRYLILKKKLAEKLLTGLISAYYFAGIPKFKKVIESLDQLSRDEFKNLYDNYERYNALTTEAFIQEKSNRLSVVKLTNDAIFNLRNSK